MGNAPSAEVIRSFGGDPSRVVSLAGGEGTSWRAGSIVLKPAGPEAEVAWVGALVESLDHSDHVRVAKHLRTTAGEYVCEGWAATEWLDGEHRSDRWDEALAAARAFHGAALELAPEWPAFMRDRSDPWSRATRVAWAEEAMPSLPRAAAEMVDGVVDLASSPVSPRFQVIHSDLAGNVLFADDPRLPPAIIDVSPQCRTAQYAEAILVADAVAWNGASPSFAEQFLGESRERLADVARAIIFRVTTAALFPNTTSARVDGEAQGYRRLVSILMP
ncbi:MAG: hypothetical protein ACT452_04385 [Microthrixaceae bacterium]